jgi:hypothetical protein
MSEHLRGQPPSAVEGGAIRALVAGYDPAFRRTMRVEPAGAEDRAAVEAALATLDPADQDLAMGLLVGAGPGEAVPERFRGRIDAAGPGLWQAAVLLPRAAASPGSTIDPRFYAGFCRVNPVLAGHQPLPELEEPEAHSPSSPPTDTRWDAIVVAAALEAEPPRVTRQGVIRKDDERRIFDRLGGDGARWQLAMALAMASGLARPAAGALHGFPESRPRPVTDPAALVDDEGPRAAAGALLRIVRRDWVSLPRLSEALRQRCPVVFAADQGLTWADRELVWLRRAADVLHRVGVLEGERGPEGLLAVRRAGPGSARSPGFLLTPDREILVAPGELHSADYGRLCRLAPYVDGDVLHRHRLTREGLAADLAAGHDDAAAWLLARSRTGLPSNVRASLEEWGLAAARVTLLSGVTVIEQGGAFSLAKGPTLPGARVIAYDSPPPASFSVEEGVIRVEVGADALTVRALLAQVGEPLPREGRVWRWRIAPRPARDPENLLDQLRRYHSGELPGELEAAVHAASGRRGFAFEPCVVLHLPTQAAESLVRDRVVAPLLGRSVAPGQHIVAARDLETVRERLVVLGFLEGEGS